jgi:hypothetical protein
MTTTQINRQYILLSRPEGLPDRRHFELREAAVREPLDGEVLIRTRYLSVDPTNRLWMSSRKQYMPPVEPGQVMRALGLGNVERSNHPDFRAGDLVSGLLGWQDYNVVRPNEIALSALPKLDVPLTAFLCPNELRADIAIAKADTLSGSLPSFFHQRFQPLRHSPPLGFYTIRSDLFSERQRAEQRLARQPALIGRLV